MKNLLLFIFLLPGFLVKAQEIKKEATVTPQLLLTKEIRINPKDSAMMNEKDLILSPVYLTLDSRAKIYTKEERDSIVNMVITYKKSIQK